MKNKIVYLIYLIIFAFIVYCGIESKNIEIIDSKDFFTIYFDSFQKYLFMGTLIMLPIISIMHIDYMKPEIKIRTKSKTFEYTWKKYFINTIITTFFIMTAFIIVAFICKYDSPFSILNIDSLLRIISFIISCYVICECIYLITQKTFLSIAGIAVLNFTLLVIVLGINFYIMVNSMDEDIFKFILMTYNSTINILGISFLYFNCDKKELIK